MSDDRSQRTPTHTNDPIDVAGVGIRTGGVGSMRWSTAPDAAVSGVVAAATVVGSSLVLWAIAVVADQRWPRRALLLRRIVLAGSSMALAGAVWAGFGVRGVAIGRWCRLPGAGWFDRRGARSRPASTWPHPIWRERRFDLLLADGSVRRTRTDGVSLRHLLAADEQVGASDR